MELFEIWAIAASIALIAHPVTTHIIRLYKEHKEFEELFL